MIGGETHVQLYNAIAGPTIALTIPVEAEAAHFDGIAPLRNGRVPQERKRRVEPT